MKATLTLFICLALSWHLTAVVWAEPENQDPSQRAHELLEFSDKQNATNHAVAVQTAQEALALFQSVNDQAGMAMSYAQLGRCHYAQNNLSQSTHYYDMALQAWQQQHNVTEEANILITLGWIEARKGEWLNGISYLTQAHNLVDEQNNLNEMARIAAGMGYVFNESGLPENGLTQYQRALEFYRQAKKPRPYNRQIMMVGYTYFLLENYPAALTHLQQALDHFESSTESDSTLDAAECHEYMGQVYIATGQYDLALQHLLPIPQLYDKSANQRDAAQVNALIGQIYQRQGAIDRARASYLEASRTFQQVSDRVKDAAVHFALGRLELSEGNYDAAESYLKESIKSTEDIRGDLKSRVLAAAFSASVRDRYEAYIDCLIRKHKQQPAQGFEAQAFQASELSRARSLAELLRDTQTNVLAGADPKLIEQEKTLRQQIRARVDQAITLLATDYKRAEFDELETSLTRLREQHKTVAATLRTLNPNYDRINEPAAFSVQQIQNEVIEDDQTMLLEYLLGENGSYVWAITRSDVRVFELPRAALITEAVRKVYDILAIEPDNDTDDRLNKATAELGQMVLGRLTDQLKAQRLIVVADGALNYIPFQLLPDPSGNREPLIANYEVINAPSASILAQLREEKEQRRPRPKTLAAFGDPVFASNYEQYKNPASSELAAAAKTGEDEPWRRAWRDIEVTGDSFDPSVIQSLLYSKIELKNLSDIAGPGSFVAKGFDASREMLKSTDFSNYAILHFATHGLLDPESPENSGFFLSMVDSSGRPQDGFITMKDVYSLQVPVDLVVLSACRTGLGKNVRGEGLIGLTRGFMHAGASSVVASLWKVDDEATAELMKQFYTNMLQKSMRPAEALRAAQNTVRRHSQWQSPHFWAGFILQGEFKQPIRMSHGASATVQKAIGGALLLILLIGIAWVYWRRREKLGGVLS